MLGTSLKLYCRSCLRSYFIYIHFKQMSSTRTLRTRITVKAKFDAENDADAPKKKSPRKQKHVEKPAIKQENNIILEDSDFAPDAKQVKLEVPNGGQKANKSPKKVKNLKNEIKKEIEKQKHVEKPAIKQENDIKLEDSDFATDAKQLKLEVPKVDQKTSKSPKKVKNLKNEVKKEIENVGDIESCGWEPDNWKEVYENILKMRKMYVAPVDSLGAEECPEKDVKPEVFRYQTLISVMLSSQTKDQVTFAATQRLIEHGLNVDNILKTPDEKIGELIYPAGFWKSKVRYIKQTTQILKDQYNGDIPRTFKELCKLPGVGPKMANIVMSVGWNDTVGIAVDTHVHRISNRLGWVPKSTKDPEQTMKALESWLPKDLWRPINITLVGFGQTICRPVGPSCEECLNKNICSFGKTVLSGKAKKKCKS